MKNQMKRPNFKLATALWTVTGTTFFVVPAFAWDPIGSLGTTISSGAGSLFQGILILVAIVLIINRDWIKAISALGVAILLSVFMDKTMLGTITKSIFDNVLNK